MLKRGTKVMGALLAPVTALCLAGIAGAESLKVPEAKGAEISERQEAALGGEVGGTTQVGSRPAEAQAPEDVAASRTRELDQQMVSLSRDLEAQKETAAASQAQLEERARAAYKGEDLAGISLVLDSLFGTDDSSRNAVLNGPAARTLTKGRQSVRAHQESQRALKDTIRQLDQKKKDYRRSQQEQQVRAEELRRREAKPQDSDKSGSKKEQMEARIAELRAAERIGGFTRPPATASGGTPEMREQELEIAQEDIVAQPVEPIPYERYVQLYKASAKRYGFAKDWYVLAAVGKVESNHGENMGPSSAGAMGPMQFLPSTWREYGTDGNRDGVANIMDPEDAVPAAAAYLKAGGAPKDWYAALYTYNHAGWYVRKVLGMAEGYRRLANDDKVEPYV